MLLTFHLYGLIIKSLDLWFNFYKGIDLLERIFDYYIENLQDGKTIRDYLKGKGFSTALLSRLKQHSRGILLNGQRVFVNTLLVKGDRLELLIEDENEFSENILPFKGELNILYEDEDMLVINKPPFLPVHPSKGHPYDCLANIVAYYYAQKGKKFVFRCVNRLDKDTSGVVVIAKNSFIHDALCQQSIMGQINKNYIAVVHGEVAPDKGTIDAPIYRPNIATIKRIVSPLGQKAITHYEVISKSNGLSILKVKLETGRTHQIRVHFSYLGHPLVGDFLYGDENDGFLNRQALHCCSIALIHPITGQIIEFKTDLPEDMRDLTEIQ
ncbi:MAG: pseudouridine synthase, RluA family [Clostridia bacterium]|nr:pseudouridine synthase, RluA family [Clostridia bacterium]